MSKEIFEYRGVEGLVAAEVIKDDSEEYVTGTPFEIAGVAEIGRSTENSQESHYYDNMAAIVVNSVGADTVTCSVSAIPLDVLAKITGQKWDATRGAFIEGSRENKYFALGYKTKKTNGEEVYVWRLKGTFSIPDQTNTTENDGTDANGQEIVFTGISTTHKFTNAGGKGCKALNVDVAKGLSDVSTFFDMVTTPDLLGAVAKVATPVATPEAGNVASGTKVRLSCRTYGATIYYTLDGSTPDESDTEYTGAITISESKTIKAIAVLSGKTDSDVLTAAYTISV